MSLDIFTQVVYTYNIHKNIFKTIFLTFRIASKSRRYQTISALYSISTALEIVRKPLVKNWATNCVSNII